MKYIVGLRRTTVDTAEVIVEATSEDAAEKAARDQYPKMNARDWTLDDETLDVDEIMEDDSEDEVE
ncbi:MAG: hypothetical protein ACREBW_01975 [Candidatus Micrarchaeaceae archaeon]